MRFLFSLLFLGFSGMVFGQANQYTFNENCRLAYQAFMAGKIMEGKRLTQVERGTNPNNLIPILLDNYADYVSLSFNENPVVFEQRESLQSERLSRLEKGNKQSPYHLLCRALIHLQWSMIRAKNGDKWNAAWDFRRSYLLLLENKKRFPDFEETDIFLGASEAIISTIPSGYKWISELLGLRGDMRIGMQRLNKQVLTRKSPFAEEANLYYIFLKHYLENDIHGAQAYIQLLHLDVKNNWLNCFIAANLAINHKDAATAEQLLNNRTRSAEYMAFPMLDYELGDAKLKRLDYTCVVDFSRYLQNTHSKFYIKDAWLSIAYAAYLQNNMAEVKRCFERIKREGSLEADADQEALRIAEAGVLPDKDLLRARLLNDGGYNEEALRILQARPLSSFKPGNDQIEYIYRLARIHDELLDTTEAIEFYILTLQQAEQTKAYYPARAALQLGYIFEARRKNDTALVYFNRVLALKGHDYKNSLDQKAKAAINRIKNK